MTITNLTAKENNGVVVAEFESGSAKVTMQVNKDTLVDLVLESDSEVFQYVSASIADLIDIVTAAEKWVSNNLETAIHELIKYWNFNLQEAE